MGPQLLDNTEHINAYISRDAGMSWNQLAVGEHTYEMGSYGSLIVMSKTKGSTSNIRFVHPFFSHLPITITFSNLSLYLSISLYVVLYGFY